MKPITEYAKQEKLRLLLQGPPGAGKTVVACQFPRPYIVDLDRNLAGPIRTLKRLGLPLPVGYDNVDVDDTGKTIPENLRYERLTALLKAADASDEIDTIVIDSATNLSTLLVSETLRKQNKPTMSKQEWGFFFNYGKQLMEKLTNSRKHIVLTGHEKINKTEDGAVVYPVQLAWPGQLGTILGAFFTDVWRCEVKETPAGMDKSIYKWLIRTTPNAQYSLKNGFGFDSIFEFSWSKIEPHLLK